MAEGDWHYSPQENVMLQVIKISKFQMIMKSPKVMKVFLVGKY